MSSAGSTEQKLIGCRQVSYFKPLAIAVLNTTVIFEDYEHQKNLDPLQKLTGDYIKRQLPDATRVARRKKWHKWYKRYKWHGFWANF